MPSTSAAGGERRDLRARAGGRVERAGREARRDGHALEQPGAGVRHPLRHGLLVDVDAVAVARREGARVARRLREPDQQQREGGDADRRVVLGDHVQVGQQRRGQPARHVPDQRDAVRAQVEQVRRQQASRDEHERARDRRRRAPQAEDHRERDAADEHGRPVRVAQRGQPRRELAPRAVAFGRRAGELGQLPDHDVDGRAGEEARDHRLRQEAGDPAHLQQRPAAGTAGRSRARSPRRAAPPPHPRARPRSPRRRRRPPATSSARWRCAARCRRARTRCRPTAAA